MKYFTKRLVATIIDCLIVYSIYKATRYTFDINSFIAITNAVIFQFCISTYIFNNSTLGKKIFGLEVNYNYEKENLTSKNLLTLNFAREFLKWMMLLNVSPILVFAQIIFIFISKDRSSLYDWALNSNVIEKEVVKYEKNRLCQY